MIYIGQNTDREGLIAQYMKEHELNKVVIFSSKPINAPAEVESMFVPYKECIEYIYYYKYLAFCDKNTLFVWNDCLSTKTQNCLEYNCIRHCAEQTSHHLIFNALPLIDDKEDFMILYTLQEPNPFVKFKCEDVERFENLDFSGFVMPNIIVHKYESTEKQREKYEKIKEDAIRAVRRDPNIIPRRCLKYSESLVQGNYDSKKEFLPRDMNVTDSGLPVDCFFLRKLINIQQDIRYVQSKI